MSERELEPAPRLSPEEMDKLRRQVSERFDRAAEHEQRRRVLWAALGFCVGWWTAAVVLLLLALA